MKSIEPNTNMFRPLDKTSGEQQQSAPAKYLAQISVPINQSAVGITWQSFESTLTNCLDTFTVRQAISIVEECIKLENYLNGEFQLNDKEIYFTNQKQIVDHLNKSLKKKLFSLSRSTELFNQHKRDLVTILRNKLISPNLIDVLEQFNYLEDQYYKLVETIKSRLKFKIAKLEKSLQVWQEFDRLCRKLNSLFDASSNMVSIDTNNLLEYRGLVHDISSCLNNLKEHHSLLSATCTENKYFEMKNLIVLYECKFGRLKEKFEAASSMKETQRDFHLKYFTKTTESSDTFYLENMNGKGQNDQRNDYMYNRNNGSGSDSDNQVIPVMVVQNNKPNTNGSEAPVLRYRSNKNHNILINDDNHVYTNNARTAPEAGRSNGTPRGVLASQDLNQKVTNKSPIAKRKAIMCDKSTFTINEISTQTEEPFEYHVNQVLTREHLRTIEQHHHFTKRFTNKDSVESHKPDLTGTESDGKQLLLEAYLRNNESLAHEQQESSQTTSSQSSSSLLPNGMKSKPGKKRKSLITTGTRESGIGTYIDDELGTSSCDLDFSKTSNSAKKVTNSYQNTDNESFDKLNDNSAASTKDAYYSKTASKTNKAKSKHASKTRHLSKSNTVKNSFESNAFRKPSVEHNKQPFFIEEDVNIFESKTAGWFSWFFKTFITFLLFFLTILFVIFVYFFYSQVLNPSCCDYKRQYLMFNVS